jgi:23S rRNA (cytidine1920-2'-O)/16S rRNA (cytidine1409-2'-O)-methyltransferase
MAAAKRERLDVRVVELGLAESRTRAQALILAGQILVDETPVDKPGTAVSVEAIVRLRGEPLRYVSRGGLKLEHALDHFGLDPRGLDCLDLGASTGGFTDCLLQRGARRVAAVDVGYNQLAWKLRDDPRVASLERVNARNLSAGELPFQPALAVCDVSFISATLMLPRLVELLPPGAPLVILVKPQFEVGKDDVGKGGVVREPALRQGAVDKVCSAAGALGCSVVGVVQSPILGPAGNVEFLALFLCPGEPRARSAAPRQAQSDLPASASPATPGVKQEHS